MKHLLIAIVFHSQIPAAKRPDAHGPSARGAAEWVLVPLWPQVRYHLFLLALLRKQQPVCRSVCGPEQAANGANRHHQQPVCHRLTSSLATMVQLLNLASLTVILLLNKLQTLLLSLQKPILAKILSNQFDSWSENCPFVCNLMLYENNLQFLSINNEEDNAQVVAKQESTTEKSIMIRERV